MDTEQMNLGLSDYGESIAKLLVWLPALPKQQLDVLLDFVKAEVSANGETSEVLSAYTEEEERCCLFGLTEVSFVNHLIQEYAPIQLNKLQEKLIELEGANSGLDALVEQLQKENQELFELHQELVNDNRQLTYVADEQKDKLKILEHNEKYLRKQVRDLSVQALTCIQILKICSNTDRCLTHSQRKAFAEVGLNTLQTLFPKGITPENFPCHEDYIRVNSDDNDPIPFESKPTKYEEFY
ncbi:hypothetical protein PL8927_510013 [Planktothrix serta PCC 8927]|uniref:Uncharacterized protein n=1 Tax=Planktothrix serta PCC 8927 TaxID=671068 RepID=A0A7Z9E076_9CYAN|nr:hypothetical protein [Planktothrix serta]VXD15983.1 hypothetical protein PL8927_510013 [Planktothrix serta PCC 8927]